MTAYSLIESPLGQLLLTAHDDSLNGIYFADQTHAPQIRPDWVRRDNLAVFVELQKQLRQYTAGECRVFDLPIEMIGSRFQVRVWEEITTIPFGQTISYSELAERLGDPKAVRAVGSAVGENPLCWILPCHRVIGKDGSLTGYAGGLTRKKMLLDFEAARNAGREMTLSWDEPACTR